MHFVARLGAANTAFSVPVGLGPKLDRIRRPDSSGLTSDVLEAAIAVLLTLGPGPFDETELELPDAAK